MPESHEIAFETFGVRVAVITNIPDGPDLIEPLLPPFSTPATRSGAAATFILEHDGEGGYRFGPAGVEPAVNLQLYPTLEALAREMRTAVALHAPRHIFLHAGVVAQADKAILIPGVSFSGKTTLVAALVRAGAVYLSDEYAPIDEHGLVHPFPTPLGLRNSISVQIDHDVRSFGGRVADRAFPIGVVVLTRYEQGAAWNPERKSTGTTVLDLIEHAVPAQQRSRQTLETIARALEHATVLRGERGDADALAPLLLGSLGSGRAA
jgi:hypothetical protein